MKKSRFILGNRTKNQEGFLRNTSLEKYAIEKQHKNRKDTMRLRVILQFPRTEIFKGGENVKPVYSINNLKYRITLEKGQSYL